MWIMSYWKDHLKVNLHLIYHQIENNKLSLLRPWQMPKHLADLRVHLITWMKDFQKAPNILRTAWTIMCNFISSHFKHIRCQQIIPLQRSLPHLQLILCVTFQVFQWCKIFVSRGRQISSPQETLTAWHWLGKEAVEICQVLWQNAA